MKKINQNKKFNSILDNHLTGNLLEFNRQLNSLSTNDLRNFCIFTTDTITNFLKKEG